MSPDRITISSKVKSGRADMQWWGVCDYGGRTPCKLSKFQGRGPVWSNNGWDSVFVLIHRPASLLSSERAAGLFVCSIQSLFLSSCLFPVLDVLLAMVLNSSNCQSAVSGSLIRKLLSPKCQKGVCSPRCFIISLSPHPVEDCTLKICLSCWHWQQK